MPQLIRLYVVNVAIGFALSAVFVALLLALDVAGLRRLVLGTQGGWLGGLMLWFFNGVVFAGVQFAIAVMRLGEDEEAPPAGPRLPAPTPRLVRIPVVRARDRRPPRG